MIDGWDTTQINFPQHYSRINLDAGTWIPDYIDQDWEIAGLTASAANNRAVGMQFLWETFFRDYVVVSEEDWSSIIPDSGGYTNAQFYTDIFKTALHEWVAKLEDHNLLPEDHRDASNPLCNNYPTQTLIGPHPSQALASDSYLSWFTDIQAGQLTTWFQAAPLNMASQWKYYLESVGEGMRTQASTIWLFLRLLNLLQNIEHAVETLATRQDALGAAEASATAAIAAAVQRMEYPHGHSDVSTPVINKNISMQIGIYQSYSSIAQSKGSLINSLIQQSQGTIQEQNALLASLVQQLETILGSLFR